MDDGLANGNETMDRAAGRRAAGVTGAGPAASPGEHPAGGSWVASLRAGRFGAARRAALETGSDATEDEVEGALELISAAERVARRLLDKDYSTTTRPLEDLSAEAEAQAERAGLDLGALRAEAERLREAGRALEDREIDAAEAALETALETAPSGAFAAERAALAGTIAIYRGEPESARAALELAVERDPEHVRALTNLGNLALEEERIDDAVARYEAAIAIDDEFANAHHNLGVALRRRGEIGRSVKALRTAQKLSGKRMREDARRELARGRDTRWFRRGLLLVAAAVGIVLLLRML